MNKVILSLALISIVFLSGCSFDGKSVQNADKRILEQNTVARVIDGDTLVLANDEHVRLLHINTPEKGEYCYTEAKERLAELVLNKSVWLERDMEDHDRYNRSLRFVYLSNNSEESVNQQMVEEGFAVTYILLPNTKYKNKILDAEEQAVQNKQGCLWQNYSSEYGCLQVQELRTCSDGDYVLLSNNCADLNTTGWTLRDESRSSYSLSGIIKAGSTVNITREGWQTTHECIWPDYNDELYIFDNNHQFVLRYAY